MYSLRAVADKNPLTISGAVMAVANFGIMMEWINLTAKQVAGGNVALVALLSLFVATRTANKAVLDEMGDASADVATVAASHAVEHAVAAFGQRRPLRAERTTTRR